jgi:hypothetical protein
VSRWTKSEFIEQVASSGGWDLHVSSGRWTLSGTENDLAWTCVLTLTYDRVEAGRTSSSIDWICPSIGVTDEKLKHAMSNLTAESIRSGEVGDRALPPRLSARRAGPQTDVGVVFDALKKRSLKALFRAPEYRVDIDDPAGILDDDLRERIENWPPAFTGNSDTQPVRLGMIRVEPRGLRIVTEDWWDSAAALEHQILLGIDLALRLHRSRSGERP